MFLSNFLRINAPLTSLQRTQRGKKAASQHRTSHNHNLAAASPLKANLLMMEKARDVRCLWADRKQGRQSVVICCLSHCLSICSCLAFLLVTLSRFFFAFQPRVKWLWEVIYFLLAWMCSGFDSCGTLAALIIVYGGTGRLALMGTSERPHSRN